MDTTFEVLIIAASIFFLAAFIHGSIGFGFPMIATPLLALIYDIQTAIILTLIPTLLVNLVSIASEKNILNVFSRYLSLAVLAMTGCAVGTLILIYTDSQIFEALLAIAIVMYLASEKVNVNFSWIRIYPRLSKVIFGVSAGILGGLTNVMAPVLIIYSIESKYTKSETIQASNCCFLSGKLIQLVMFISYGKFDFNILASSSLMLIIVSIALFFGIKLRRKINADIYNKILKVFLLILAGTLFVKVLSY